MKRSPMKKVSSSPLSVLQRALWTVFSLWVKIRDRWTCFTCGKRVYGSDAHAGHFIPRSTGGSELYFHPNNVHCQCFDCNIELGGNLKIYEELLGPEIVALLRALKNKTSKWDVGRLKLEIEFYKRQLKYLGYEKENYT